MQLHYLACGYISLHVSPWAYMQFPEFTCSLHELTCSLHELACSSMSLYAVPFFVWAAHKNFEVLVFSFVFRNRAAVSLFLDLWATQRLPSDHKIGSNWHLGQSYFLMRFKMSLEGGKQKKILKVWGFENDIQGVPKWVFASIHHSLHQIT